MKQIIQLLQAGFESSSGRTPEFSSFARKFKSAIKKELATIEAELTAYSVGHFYVSGFFRVRSMQGDSCYYFSLSDVRGGEYVSDHKMLYRTAKDEKDYTGGGNQYIIIGEGMAKKMVFTNWVLK